MHAKCLQILNSSTVEPLYSSHSVRWPPLYFSHLVQVLYLYTSIPSLHCALERTLFPSLSCTVKPHHIFPQWKNNVSTTTLKLTPICHHVCMYVHSIVWEETYYMYGMIHRIVKVSMYTGFSCNNNVSGIFIFMIKPHIYMVAMCEIAIIIL